MSSGKSMNAVAYYIIYSYTYRIYLLPSFSSRERAAFPFPKVRQTFKGKIKKAAAIKVYPRMQQL